jgi:hypothetical protein
MLECWGQLKNACSTDPRSGVAIQACSLAEQAHSENWRRFIEQHGVMLDFTNLDGLVDLPAPEDCRAAKPNALGWWSPMENGPMFGGFNCVH